jgi:hypothetical protein
LRLYSQKVFYTKHSYHDRLRTVSTTPPWARPRAFAELWRSTEPRCRKPFNNLTYTRANALVSTNVTNTPVARVWARWSTKPPTSSADELRTARLYAGHAPAIWHDALAGGCHGYSSSCGTCWLPRAVCDSRPASPRSTSFTSYGGSTDEGRWSCRSTVTHCCLWSHVRQHASSPDDSSGNAATTHEHSDQQPGDAAATACHEPCRPKAISTSPDASTTATAPAIA